MVRVVTGELAPTMAFSTAAMHSHALQPPCQPHNPPPHTHTETVKTKPPTHLALDLLEHCLDVIITRDLADALAAATPARLEHHWVANAAAHLERRLECGHTRLPGW